jgi:hypothetical protein
VLGEIIRDHLGATQNQLNRIIPAYANEATEHLLNGGAVSNTPIIGELGISLSVPERGHLCPRVSTCRQHPAGEINSRTECPRSFLS